MPNAHHRPSPTLLRELGANVRRARLAKGYTQEQLAELIEVHPRMIQKVEFGETNILATTAIRIRAALGCDWSTLMPDVDLPLLRVAPKRSRPSAKRKQASPL